MEWMNEAAKRLIGSNTDNIALKVPKRIDDLHPFHSELPGKLYKLKAGDLSVLQIKRKDEHINLPSQVWNLPFKADNSSSPA